MKKDFNPTINKAFEDYERPSVTADVVIFRVHEDVINNRKKPVKKLQILLIKRKEEPENDKWSLPGGFVNIDDTIENTARKKVLEKTGYKDFYMEQLYTFDGINRDTRGRIITTAYIGIIPPYTLPWMQGSHEMAWFELCDECLIDSEYGEVIEFDKLAFDHSQIIKTAIDRIRGKLFYTNIGFEFIEKTFTIGSLQNTFETILDKKIDNFKRMIDKRVLPTGEIISGKAHRPAQLFKKKEY